MWFYIENREGFDLMSVKELWVLRSWIDKIEMVDFFSMEKDIRVRLVDMQREHLRRLRIFRYLAYLKSLSFSICFVFFSWFECFNSVISSHICIVMRRCLGSICSPSCINCYPFCISWTYFTLVDSVNS